MTLDLRNLDPRWVLYAFVAAAVLAALAYGFLRYRRYTVLRGIRQAVGASAYDMLMDVLIPDGMDGQLHVDFLLLTQRGILVLSFKETPGLVFGGDQMNEWTVMTRTRRYTFANPQGPLLDRMAAVRALAGDTPVEGRILFTSRSKFPKGQPKSAVLLNSLPLEYPPVQRDAFSGSTATKFEDDWKNVKAHTTPSDLKRY